MFMFTKEGLMKDVSLVLVLILVFLWFIIFYDASHASLFSLFSF